MWIYFFRILTPRATITLFVSSIINGVYFVKYYFLKSVALPRISLL